MGREIAGVEREPRRRRLRRMFDIPSGELTPRVRRALTRLLARFDEARKRLDAGHDRELYLQGLADGDVVLPIGN